VLYNVYARTAARGPGDDGASGRAAPLNDKPLAEQTFVHAGAEPGQETVLRRPQRRRGRARGVIESDPSSPICITPKDTFPPAAPKGLAAVSSAGVINLIWDASTEADLAGYVVLRGEAPGAALEALMKDPIKETRYADRTHAPTCATSYAIVAVDKRATAARPLEQGGRSCAMTRTPRSHHEDLHRHWATCRKSRSWCRSASSTASRPIRRCSPMSRRLQEILKKYLPDRPGSDQRRSRRDRGRGRWSGRDAISRRSIRGSSSRCR
jgi:hypothetical protein